MHKRDFPTTPIYFSVPIPPLPPQYFSSHNTVVKATERKSFYEHACYSLGLAHLFLGQGSSRILAGGDDSWCSLRMVWCNYIPRIFIVQTDTGRKHPELMSKPRQHCCCEWRCPEGAPWPGRCPIMPALRRGVAGTGAVWAAAAPSPGLAPQKPTWEFLHPWTGSEGEVVVFPLGISAQRQVTVGQRQHQGCCTGCSRILSPASITPPIFKCISKSKLKSINKVLICQKETVG